MKRLILLSLLTIGVTVLSACGGPVPTVESTAQPETTSHAAAPTADPTQPAAAEAATQVQITLADNTIASTLTTFTAGVPYTLVIRNTGRHEHNFNISPPVAVAGSLDGAMKAALLSVDDSQIPPGGSTTVEFTFPASAVGAVLEFNCLIRRHYDDGMRLEITVTG